MTATTIIPADLKLGQQVNIESRTWPGINKPGGHATITKLHYDDDNTNGVPTRIDVKYVLGGTEKQIEMTYVKPHVELARGGRSRRVDKKLTVDSFTSSSSGRGGKENDEGGGMEKRGNKQNSNSGNNKRKADGLQKKKKVVATKKSKGVDNTAVVTAAKIEEEEEKVVKDDDAAQTKTTKKSAPPKKTGKKNAASASAGASNKTKSIASYFSSAGASTSSTTTKSTTARVPSKTKAKESTKNAKKASTSTTTTAKPTRKTNPTTKKSTTTKSSSPKIKYSPNSILAVRAAHAKSPAKSHIFGTKTIGSLSGFAFPGSSGVQESLFPDEREEEQRRTFAAATAALNATSSSTATAAAAAMAARPSRKKKETPTSSGKKRGASSTSLSKDKSAQNHKMMQSLYKNECVKAQEFVKSMVGSDMRKKKEEEEDGSGKMSVNSSPESLELEMDSGRMNLFNKLLSEVMFRKGLDSMDVDEMITRINTSSQRDSATKPFTLLEVKAFLQELDSQNRIFVSWEEDNTGTVYSI